MLREGVRNTFNLACLSPKVYVIHAAAWSVIFGLPLIGAKILEALFNTITGGHNATVAWILIGSLFLIAFTRALFVLLGDWAEVSLTNEVIGGVQARAFAAYITRSAESHVPKTEGDVISRFRDDTASAAVYLCASSIATFRVVFSLICISVMLKIDHRLALCAVGAIATTAWLGAWSRSTMERQKKEFRDASNQVLSFLGKAIANVDAIRGLGISGRVVDEIERLGRARANAAELDRLWSAIVEAMPTVGTYLGMVIVILIVALRNNGNLAPGAFVLFFTYSAILAENLSRLNRIRVQYRQMMIGLDQIGIDVSRRIR